MVRHPTVLLRIGEQEAEIDVEIAPLIEQIWTAGIETTNSCQENQPGMAWIEFLTAIDAADFLNAVAGEYSNEFDSLYNRIAHGWEPLASRPVGWCEYSLHPWDASVEQKWVNEDEIDEAPTGPPEFVFSVSVRFPRTDIPLLIERMRASNESDRGAEYREQRGRVL